MFFKSTAKASEALALAETKATFVDRGVPPSDDFISASMNGDGMWNDLDISAIVPVAAKSVFISVELKFTIAGSAISFRRYGDTGDFSDIDCSSQVNDHSMTVVICVPLTGNGLIQYCFMDVVCTYVKGYIIGWLI